ncbi:SDR family NAD(P)-dependent oxidoreductase [Sphingobacterium sp. HJSM2_6]|uniref:SDR family NAD(P)-dependent oxidoreductase n=1 Tax=Sphingobacterium sp. HJSM2_6 TaxID=3366264 RepID=UPI003BBBE7BB
MERKRFTNKTAIVTGAGQGIGYEMAKSLVLEGASVILNDVDLALSEKAAKEISQFGVCLPFAGDVADPNFNKDMVEFAIAQTNSLDIIMANAGITLFGSFLDYKPEDFFRVLHVNMGGAFFLAQVAGKYFIANNKRGSILFTSSVIGHQAHKDLAAYGMTKVAVEMLAKHLVLELSPYGINVNAVAPGATLTERTLEDPEYVSAWSKITPIGAPAKTPDIANAALFLVSDEAKHITGQTIVVDGGWTSVSPAPF